MRRSVCVRHRESQGHGGGRPTVLQHQITREDIRRRLRITCLCVGNFLITYALYVCFWVLCVSVGTWGVKVSVTVPVAEAAILRSVPST